MMDHPAYCGLECRTCPIYLATREEDKEKQLQMRVKIARMCKDLYGVQYEPEDITDCDSCRGNGERLFPACSKCLIRNCARQKEVETCTDCSDYACEKLEAFFATEPDARKRLEEIKSGKM